MPGKKYIGDGTFPEKLCTMDLSTIPDEGIEMINSNFLTHAEWDPAAAGKILALSEVLGKWMVAIKDYHFKRLSLTSLYEELSELKVNIFSFVGGVFHLCFSCRLMASSRKRNYSVIEDQHEYEIKLT